MREQPQVMQRIGVGGLLLEDQPIEAIRLLQAALHVMAVGLLEQRANRSFGHAAKYSQTKGAGTAIPSDHPSARPGPSRPLNNEVKIQDVITAIQRGPLLSQSRADSHDINEDAIGESPDLDRQMLVADIASYRSKI